MKIPVQRIVVDEGQRIRKETGDLTSLIASIRQVGLLNPIVVTADYRLVAGFRRLNACRQLGWTEIDANVVPYKDDLLRLLDAEVAENVVRKDFTAEEIMAIEQRRREILRMLRGNIWQRFWRWLRGLWAKIARRS
ncbi:MAG: ParB N-terminal domain-containing protein [Candidatus Binatia bacterium]